ncbi:hypothetical protein C7271_03465 [filamentous cyanobacterium CCP5]|nr:hypothetical protein C7271_03465 [filamentous cyanobacterium CCP5]
MDIDQAMLDPTSVFDSPAAVCNTTELSQDQKVEILRRWEYDARELQVATEENMGGSPGSHLDEVLAALHQLGVGASPGDSPPTKQKGQ